MNWTNSVGNSLSDMLLCESQRPLVAQSEKSLAEGAKDARRVLREGNGLENGGRRTLRLEMSDRSFVYAVQPESCGILKGKYERNMVNPRVAAL